MTDSPSLLLRRAADKLPGLAAAATKGPWRASGYEVYSAVTEEPIVELGYAEGGFAHQDDATWAAMANPLWAGPLVAWLRYTQVQYEVAERRVATYGGSVDNWMSETDRAALEFACLILGVSAEGPERSDPERT